MNALLKVIFIVIFLGNLILAVWNYLKSDYIEFSISLIIVILIIICYYLSVRKK